MYYISKNKNKGMNTNKQIKELIAEAKEGKKDFSSINKSDAFFKRLTEYAGNRNSEMAKKYGYILAHSEHSFMMLLDEINLMQREIDVQNKIIKIHEETIEIYKETTKFIKQ